jgi:P-type Ca2+ transporter type 2C
MIASASISIKGPFSSIPRLLWISLISDLGFLALAIEFPDMHLEPKPDPKPSPIITYRMSKMILGQVLIQLVVLLVVYFGWYNFMDYYYSGLLDMVGAQAHRDTFVFNTFVWLQIFNMLNTRRLDNHFNIFKGINWHFVLVALVIIGGQLLIIFKGNNAFKVVPLSSTEYAISIGIGCLSIFAGILLRMTPDYPFYCTFDFIHRMFQWCKVRLAMKNPNRSPTMRLETGRDDSIRL